MKYKHKFCQSKVEKALVFTVNYVVYHFNEVVSFCQLRLVSLWMYSSLVGQQVAVHPAALLLLHLNRMGEKIGWKCSWVKTKTGSLLTR